MLSQLYNDSLIIMRDNILPDCQIEDAIIQVTAYGRRELGTSSSISTSKKCN